MNNITLTNNGKTYKRVSKTAAKKVFESGESVVICACNLNPFGFWNCGIEIKKYQFDSEYSNDFNKRVYCYELYNCVNSETGKYASFYIEEK